MECVTSTLFKIKLRCGMKRGWINDCKMLMPGWTNLLKTPNITQTAIWEFLTTVWQQPSNHCKRALVCLRWGWSLRENNGDGVICKNGKEREQKKKEMKGRKENNKVVRKKLDWGRRRETEGGQKESALVCSVLKGVQTFVVFPGYSIWFKPPILHKKELLC